MRHYCLGGCSAPSVCARRSRPVWGARAGTWCCVTPISPFPPRVSLAACRGPSRPGVPYPRSLVRHSTRSVRSASSVRLLFVCVCSRSRGVRSPPPWVVWCAHLTWSRHWALVGPFHVVRAPPLVLPRFLFFEAWRSPAEETQNIAPMRGSPTDSRICTKRSLNLPKVLSTFITETMG